MVEINERPLELPPARPFFLPTAGDDQHAFVHRVNQMSTARRVRIKGIVHGVSFRASMAQMATELGVRGWVRNLPDGSVEAFLEGDDYRVRRLLEWARIGPPRARVDKIEVVAATPRNHRDFRIHG